MSVSLEERVYIDGILMMRFPALPLWGPPFVVRLLGNLSSQPMSHAWVWSMLGRGLCLGVVYTGVWSVHGRGLCRDVVLDDNGIE